MSFEECIEIAELLLFEASFKLINYSDHEILVRELKY
jgi:hypothetical protein